MYLKASFVNSRNQNTVQNVTVRKYLERQRSLYSAYVDSITYAIAFAIAYVTFKV